MLSATLCRRYTFLNGSLICTSNFNFDRDRDRFSDLRVIIRIADFALYKLADNAI